MLVDQPDAYNVELYLFDSLVINSPKRRVNIPTKSKEFFPYYAGFPESFASAMIDSANLNHGSIIFDPWNGSGTTTSAAIKLGHHAYGIDLNPVMVIVARARNLPSKSVENLELLAEATFKLTQSDYSALEDNDPLLQWFDFETTLNIRSIEKRIRSTLPSGDPLNQKTKLNQYSCIISNLYVALFNTLRKFIKPFRSTNPTWLRVPKNAEDRIHITLDMLKEELTLQINHIAKNLRASNTQDLITLKSNIVVGDSTKFSKKNFADFILTSPPYCTRLDYTAATRIELAVIHPLLKVSRETLSKSMIGSTKVPESMITPRSQWGSTCNTFIENLKAHHSKASSGYYYKTHIDYFDKMYRSMRALSNSLKKNGTAIIVVQDSYYKNLHNDLPTILSEMALNFELELRRKDDFAQRNSLSDINAKSKIYGRTKGAVESVICFNKIN